MKRSELSVKAMENMGWEEVVSREEPLIKDVVSAIKSYFYKYLRCTIDKSKRWEEIDYTMCSTYVGTYCYEYLEASLDNKEWFKVAKRKHLLSHSCKYSE